jgi:site-specific DNA-methyltransferase (adenine-specific)
MDISKSIDKKSGVQGEKIGERTFGKTSTGQNSGWHNNNIAQLGKQDIFAPATELAKKWQGWGTCLKPSFEPIIVARKPFKGSLVDNVIKWGVGGLNIDECRVGTEERTYKGAGGSDITVAKGAIGTGVGKDLEFTVNGRFPANTILTYDQITFDEVCGGFPNTKGNGNIRHNKNDGKGYNCYSNYGDCETKGYDDSGSASRYFYCAKASKKDRDEGLEEFEDNYMGFSNQAKAELKRGNIDFKGNENNPMNFVNSVSIRKNIHPTVKPTELMQYLVRLVSPKGATILDPFMGSGSTGKAVAYENKERNADYNFIGIELNKEYCDIAEARIKFVEGE